MERLQKVLAQAGIASRRAAEQIILAGRVRVDGKIVRELGTQVDPRKSRVEVDGTKIVAEKLVYIVLHKPRGVVCTLSDPEGRPTIRELLKEAGARVVPVGRLDFHTSGALLCTNDGEFAQALAHPKKGVPKVYVAKVKGVVDDDALVRFGERIVIDGRPTQPAKVQRLRYEGDKTWLEITLREGRNRQVRRLGEATGFPVMRLARISHAGVTSEDLRPGQWRPLSVEELVELKREFGVPKRVRPPSFEPTSARPAPGRATAKGVRGEQWKPTRAKKERPTGSERAETFGRAAPRGHERFEAKTLPERERAAPRFGAKPARFDAKPARFDAKPARSDGKPARFDAKPARSDAKPARLDARPPRFDARPPRFDAKQKSARLDAKPGRSETGSASKRSAGVAPVRTTVPRGARASSPRRGT
jgi:23S rRNA pseudouridine2605 synthase